jgi:hypothetical protein
MTTTLESLDALASGFTIANVTPFGAPPGQFVVQLVPPGVRKGAPLEVEVTTVVSQLTDADVDLNFIAKNVRFDDFAPPTADAAGNVDGGTIIGGSPIADPESLPVATTFTSLVDPFTEGDVTKAGVPGLIGLLAGTFQLPLDVTETTTVGVTVQVQWRIRDEHGHPVADAEWVTETASPMQGTGDPPLLAGEDAVAALELTLSAAFGELTLPPEPPRPRTVSAAIRLSAGTISTGWVDVPPLTLTVQLIPVPTVLLLFMHKDFKGRVLLVVPANSPIGDPPEVPLKDALDDVKDALDALGTVAGVATFFVGHLQAVKDALDNAPAVIFGKTNSESNLNDIDLETHWFPLQNDTEAEDELSSVIMIGPPGRKVEAFNKRNFETGEGQMDVVVGGELMVLGADLHTSAPATDPPGRIAVPHAPSGSRWHTYWWGDITGFGDELSSFRFGWS